MAFFKKKEIEHLKSNQLMEKYKISSPELHKVVER